MPTHLGMLLFLKLTQPSKDHHRIRFSDDNSGGLLAQICIGRMSLRQING